MDALLRVGVLLNTYDNDQECRVGGPIYVNICFACTFFTNFKDSGRGCFGVVAFNCKTMLLLMITGEGVKGGGSVGTAFGTLTTRIFGPGLRSEVRMSRGCG